VGSVKKKGNNQEKELLIRYKDVTEKKKWYKARVCGPSLPRFTGSNPARVMDVCVMCFN
jgi:hypothetical protein